MFEKLDRVIEQCVEDGLKGAFRPDGPLATSISRAFDKVTAPLAVEIKRLRQQLMWRNPAKPPRHEQPVLVSVRGDQYFACWISPADGEAGYWDSDIEYGGTEIEPDGWFEVPAFDQKNRHCFPPSSATGSGAPAPHRDDQTLLTNTNPEGGR